ncbi:MAG: uroporphyrinogen decarboxylase family protein [Bullifex sp.]
MTKRELVTKVMSGEATDITPSCFSLHFPQEEKFGDRTVKAHLQFFRDTDTDIIKIMNENAFPANPGVYSVADFSRIRVQDSRSAFVQNEVDLVRAILDEADGDRYPMCTIQGVIASLGHSMRPQYQPLDEIRALQCACYRENPGIMKDAVKRVTESLCYLVRAVIEAGCDSIFYAVLGGEKNCFTRDEAEDIQAPFDKEVLKAAKDAGGKVILHLCKTNLDFERFASYGPYIDGVNWGVYENSIPLEEGLRLFPGKTILGGLEHRSGIIREGSDEEIKAEVHSLRKRMKGHPYILGADCTLATDQDRNKVKTAVEAARDIL